MIHITTYRVILFCKHFSNPGVAEQHFSWGADTKLGGGWTPIFSTKLPKKARFAQFSQKSQKFGGWSPLAPPAPPPLKPAILYTRDMESRKKIKKKLRKITIYKYWASVSKNDYFFLYARILLSISLFVKAKYKNTRRNKFSMGIRYSFWAFRDKYTSFGVPNS